MTIEMVLQLPASPAVLDLIRAGGFDVRMEGHSPCPVSVSNIHVVQKT